MTIDALELWIDHDLSMRTRTKLNRSVAYHIKMPIHLLYSAISLVFGLLQLSWAWPWCGSGCTQRFEADGLRRQTKNRLGLNRPVMQPCQMRVPDAYHAKWPETVMRIRSLFKSNLWESSSRKKHAPKNCEILWMVGDSLITPIL